MPDAIDPQLHYQSTSPADTERYGRLIGDCAVPGLVVLLVGPLGAGKTVLARGVATGLGYEGYVRSPTFTLIHEYPGRLPVYHFDLYRLNEADQLLDLGVEEYFYGDGVCLVEWAERARLLWPEDYLLIRVDRGIDTDEETRNLTLTARGTLSERVLSCVASVRESVPGEGSQAR